MKCCQFLHHFGEFRTPSNLFPGKASFPGTGKLGAQVCDLQISGFVDW